MKNRKLYLLLIIILVFFAWIVLDPAVDREDLERDFIPKSAEVFSGKQDRSWIPFLVRNNPKRLYSELFKRDVVIGFPDIDQIYTITRGDSKVEMSLHVFDNFVRGITVSTNIKGRETAKQMIKSIKQQYPFLPIRLIEKE
jgi:hypothetical protein